MIILDIETSGLTGKSGIWQIGALELENSKNYFLQEAKIDKEDIIEEEALKITGKTEEELRDPSKQNQKQLIENYLSWLDENKEKIISGANVGWDMSIIQDKCIKYDLTKRLREVCGHRVVDLQTIAQEKYFEINKKYLLDKKGRNDMSLGRTLEFCGIPDNRINIKSDGSVKYGKPHDALDDCKLEGECIMRIKFGKNLFSEYSQYEIPEALKK